MAYGRRAFELFPYEYAPKCGNKCRSLPQSVGYGSSCLFGRNHAERLADAPDDSAQHPYQMGTNLSLEVAGHGNGFPFRRVFHRDSVKEEIAGEYPQ